MIQLKWPIEAFWNDEQRQEIISTLFSLIFSLVLPKRKEISDCFKEIIFNIFPNSLPIITQILTLFNSTTPENLPTLLELVSHWAYAYSRHPLPSDALASFQSVISGIFEKIQQICSQTTDFFIYQICSTSLRYLCYRFTSFYFLPSFSSLLPLLTTAISTSLSPNTNEEAFVNMKISIARFLFCVSSQILKSNHSEETANPEETQSIPETDLPTNPELYDPEFLSNQEQFSATFRAEFAPQLLEAVVASLPSAENSRPLLFQLLRLFKLFLIYKICPETIITPNFIKDILIPASRLTHLDIAEFEENPIQFVSFNFTFHSEKSLKNLPTTWSDILTIIINDYGKIQNKFESELIDSIYDLLTEPTTNPFDFESRIFLMTRFIKVTTTSIGPMVDPDFVQMLLDVLNDPNVPHLWAKTSILEWLNKVLPKFDPNQGYRTAATVILGCDDVSLICSASKLLKNSVIEVMGDEQMEGNSFINRLQFSSQEEAEYLQPGNILSKLMAVSSMFHEKWFTHAIETIVKLGAENAYEYISSLTKEHFSYIFTLISESQQNEEEIQDSLCSIYEILYPLPRNHPMLIELSEDVLTSLSQIFDMFPEIIKSSPEIFSIASIFTEIPQPWIPSEGFIGALSNIMGHVMKDEAKLNSMKQITFMLAPILRIQPILEAAISFIEQIFNFVASGEDITIEVRSYALLLAATMIQYQIDPEISAHFVTHAISELGNITGFNQSNLFSACVAVFGAISYAIPDNFLTLIPPDAINFLFQFVNTNMLQTRKEMRNAFIFFCQLAKLGNADALQKANELLIPYGVMKLEDDGVLRSIAKNAFLEIDFTDPLDNVNEFQLFYIAAKSYGNMLQKLGKEAKTVLKTFYKYL